MILATVRVNQNMIRTWKETHHPEFYFNCASSSDLPPIENCWAVPKQHLRKFPRWDDGTTKDLIVERWSHLTQSFINAKVSEIPDRLKAVIDGDDQLTVAFGCFGIL